jgi:hypothetical protein
MLLSGKWDVRVSNKLVMFLLDLKLKRKNWYNLSYDESCEFVKILCTSYGVPMLPILRTEQHEFLKEKNYLGYCRWLPKTGGIIYTFPNSHLRILAHEVYHHIDFYFDAVEREQRYESCDKEGVHLASVFEQKFWHKVQRLVREAQKLSHNGI